MKKQKAYMDLLYEWVKLKQNISTEMKCCDRTAVAVWGKGIYCKLLLNELEKQNIEVKCIIETQPLDDEFEGIPIINISNLYKDIDTIVVVPYYDIKSIKERIYEYYRDIKVIGIDEYITENQLDRNVTIKGFVSNGNITYLYRHAVGLVMPSYFGPTNIPPLEAMALGCPVAVSDKYAMPEQVGSAGLIFNPDSPVEMAECIKKMWCDDKLRQRMIRRGYARINKWTQKEFCERLRVILDRI